MLIIESYLSVSQLGGPVENIPAWFSFSVIISPHHLCDR